MFDDGVLQIYRKKPGETESGTPTTTLDFDTEVCYGEINFTVSEFYAARQANVKVDRRVRIHQYRAVCNKHAVMIDGEVYDVGRVFHGDERGVAVTDITLESVTSRYDVKEGGAG